MAKLELTCICPTPCTSKAVGRYANTNTSMWKQTARVCQMCSNISGIVSAPTNLPNEEMLAYAVSIKGPRILREKCWLSSASCSSRTHRRAGNQHFCDISTLINNQTRGLYQYASAPAHQDVAYADIYKFAQLMLCIHRSSYGMKIRASCVSFSFL